MKRQRRQPVFRVSAYDGDYRAKDLLSTHTPHKLSVTVPTLLDAEVALARWLIDHPSVERRGGASIEEFWPWSGDHFVVGLWEPSGKEWKRTESRPAPAPPREPTPKRSPVAEKRATLAEQANEAARLSRRGGAPRLSAKSSRVDVTRWLQWNDPNGSHLDDLARGEGADPYTESGAWKALEEMLKDL